MLYINARSLLPNVDELLVLASVDKPKMICITESWMCHDNISDKEISIPGFQLFRRDRNRHGGGVLMYVSDALQCKRLVMQYIQRCGKGRGLSLRLVKT